VEQSIPPLPPVELPPLPAWPPLPPLEPSESVLPPQAERLRRPKLNAITKLENERMDASRASCMPPSTATNPREKLLCQPRRCAEDRDKAASRLAGLTGPAPRK